MKITLKKLLALGLSLCLICGCGAMAAAALPHTEPAAPVVSARRDDPETPDQTASREPDTLYVFADARGEVNKVMAGEETVDADCPVQTEITYTLDGKDVRPEQLAGQSGKVSIRYAYTTEETFTARLENGSVELPQPYAVLTGLILDDARFSNVRVSHGKVVNDGSRVVVLGVAMPGLAEALDVEEETLSIPSEVEITADVTDFQLDMSLCVITKELFTAIDPDRLTSTDELKAQLEQLSDGMAQLLDGADQLSQGLDTLEEKSGQLESGVNQIADGANSVADGAAQLDAGAATLQSGADSLSAGLSTLAGKSSDLNAGAAQVFNSLLSAANTQLAAAGLQVSTLTIGNYASVLNGVIASLDSQAVYAQALQQVTAAVEAQRDTVRAGVTEAVRAQVQEQVTEAVRAQVNQQVAEAVEAQVTEQVIQAATGMSAQDYNAAVEAGLVDEETQAAVQAALTAQLGSEAVQAQIAAAQEAQMATDQVQALIADQLEAQMVSDQVQQLIADNTEAQIAKLIADNMESDAVQAKLAAASEGARSVMALKTSLDSYNAFYLGVQAYTAGVNQASLGAKELSSGAAQVKDGADALRAGAAQLADGTSTLRSNMPELLDGVHQLAEGAAQLADGLHTLDEEGISKLTNLGQDQLLPLLDRLQAVAEAAREGENVRYLMRTESIG